MASLEAIARRRAGAIARLDAQAGRIGGTLPDPPAAPVYSKDPAIATVQRLEWLADLLERIAPDAASGSPPVDEPDPAPPAAPSDAGGAAPAEGEQPAAAPPAEVAEAEPEPAAEAEDASPPPAPRKPRSR